MSKTKIIINAILLFVVFYVVKCNVEETKEREMLVQIDAACEKNDFETAYKIISELDIINNSESYKKRKAVTEKEVLYLVSLNSEDASNRIVYLFICIYSLLHHLCFSKKLFSSCLFAEEMTSFLRDL